MRWNGWLLIEEGRVSIERLLQGFKAYLMARPEPQVSAWVADFDWNLPQRQLSANHPHAERHLDTVLRCCGPTERGLVEAFLEARDQLHWFQSYDAGDFGQGFIDNYAHVELVGTRGHFASDRLAGGLVLFGPGLVYPDHWHLAEELYFPLTDGALWSRNGGPFVERKSGEFIFHESNMAHAMTMQSNPLLALWVWRGNVLVQKSDYRKT